MKWFRIIICNLFILTLYSNNLVAQNFKNISFTEGLQSVKISNLFQDKNSVLWIATYGGGLIKYDGVNFESIYNREDNSTLFTKIIFEDSDSTLFIGNSLGLYKYKKGSYFKIPLLDSSFKDNVGFKLTYQVSGILKKEKRYFVSTSRGVIELTDNKAIPYGFTEPYIFNNDIIEFQNNIYVCSENGLRILNTKERKIDTLSGLSNLSCRKAIIFKDTLLIASNKGLLYFKNNKLIKVLNSTKFNGFPNELTYIYKSNYTDIIWLGYSGGIIKLFPNQKYEILNERNGLDNTSISSIIEQKDGTIIASSNISGLYISKGRAFNNYKDQNDSLASQVISIFKFNDSLLYFLTPNKLNKINIVTDEISQPINFSSEYVFKDFVISNNKIYLYTLNNKLVITDLNRRKNIKTINGPQNTSLNKLYIDKKGIICLATSKGSYYLNQEENEIMFENVYLYNKASHVSHVFDIYETKAEEKYFLTGKRLIKENNGKYITINNSEVYYFKNIVEDYKKNLWIIAQEDFLLYDGKSFISVKNKLDFSYTNIKLLQTFNNYLIITSDNGIYVFNLYDFYKTGLLTYNKFNEDDGAASCINISIRNVIDKNGNLWYGSNNGLVKFNINALENAQEAPNLILKKIKLYYEDVNWSEAGFETNENIPCNLILPYKKNNLTFNFVGINLNNPFKVLYSIKLEGLDEDFSKETKINEINYSNIQPGEYNLIIKAKIEGGDWGNESIRYHFIIKPPFYATWWFRVVVIVFLISIIVLIFKLRLKSIKARNVYLEETVNKRTRELDHKNKLLNEVNTSLDQKNKLIINSLEYAQTLQKNILKLNNNFIQDVECIGKSNIFYKPKDIVSGDFYASFTQGDNIYIIVADCTGHGVPGALMTIFSHSILKKVILEEKIADLKKILQRVNELFLENLKGKDEFLVNEGMAISILEFNKLSNEFRVAGVQQSIFLLADSEITEFVFNSNPINSLINNNQYEIKEIFPKKRDTIIFFTDGIIDQKGGGEKRRLMKAGFKNWILSSEDRTYEYYSKKLDEWKLLNEQVDDILIFEIKV